MSGLILQLLTCSCAFSKGDYCTCIPQVLADKVAERKKRKADSLVEQQKLDTERLLTEQTKARNELESKQVCVIYLYFQ